MLGLINITSGADKDAMCLLVRKQRLSKKKKTGMTYKTVRKE